jgi:hypothetical protein
MFEKEANLHASIMAWDEDVDTWETIAERSFQQGAEFGYNKANEWHYVKDETLPEDVPLLCVRGGKIYVAWYWDNIYHDSKCCQVKKPYAWKKIVLPKESE